MIKNIHDLDNSFREALEDNEVMPEPNVWNNIDNALDKSNLLNIKRRFKSLRWITAALLLLISGMTVYYWQLSQSSDLPLKKLQYSNNHIKMHKNIRQNNIPAKPDSTIHSNIHSNDIKGNLERAEAVVNNETKIAYRAEIPDYAPGTHNVGNVALKKITKTKNNHTPIAASYYPNIGVAESKPFRSGINTNSTSNTEFNNGLTSKQPSQNLLVALSFENYAISNIIHDSTLLTKLINPNAFRSDFMLHNDKRLKKTAIRFPNKLHGFSLTTFFSSDKVWNRLQVDKPGNQVTGEKDIEENENHGFSYTTGIIAEYKLIKHWVIQTGVTFSKSLITGNAEKIYAQQDNTGSIKYRLNNSYGYSYLLPSFNSTPNLGDSLYALRSTNTIKYIGIPVMLAYNLKFGRFSFDPSLGISTNFLVNGKIETTLENGNNSERESITNIEGLNAVYLHSQFGVASAYSINNRVSLVLAPTARFALTSINDGGVVKSYPNSFALAAGVRIKL